METDKEKTWTNVLENLKLSLSAANFSTWFPKTHIINFKDVPPDRQITEIGCPNTFIRDTIESRYYALIKEALDQATHKKNDLVFSVKQKEIKEGSAPKAEKQNTLFSPPEEKKTPYDLAETIRKVGLRSDFNFETFAVSSSNQMAHAAALAVSKSPGKAYNPLFLYGGVGVGKTHLMHAVGNDILSRHPNIKVLSCTGEEFTNEIVYAIREKNTNEFKKRYRSVKVLLIDDIQFIAGKDTVQEEFFHTFNAIWRAGGQIIMTADRRPDEIDNLEDRLRSRFEGGLTIDIQPPDFELRTAILLIKAQQHNFSLPMDVAQAIAGNITSTRKLEGFLTRLITEAQMKGELPTPEMVNAILGKVQEPSSPRRIVNIKEINRAVAEYYNIKISDLSGPRRLKPIVVPRQILMYILRIELNIPLTEIGRILGNRDHTTIMHGVEKITKLLPESESLRVDIAGIKKRLWGYLKNIYHFSTGVENFMRAVLNKNKIRNLRSNEKSFSLIHKAYYQLLD